MKNHSVIRLSNFSMGNRCPLVLIAGPCIIESKKHTFNLARSLKGISGRHKIPLIFKCSYDKANRSSINSYRGPGLKEGLEILDDIKTKLKIPLLIDVHSVEEIPGVAEIADVIQIPAFLCRQTDLITAAARTGKPVNVKKGQFLAPWDTKNILLKVLSAGNRNIMLTERGTSFGYNNLVVDMKGLEIMKALGCPVIFDATHSVQLPGGLGNASGGSRQFILPLAKAATAVGVAGLYVEVHHNPEKALSDGPNSIKLNHVSDFIRSLLPIDRIVKNK